MKIDPNAPAYPSRGSMGQVIHPGMSIRLEIARGLLAGMMANHLFVDAIGAGPLSRRQYAVAALDYADALIDAHNRSEP